MQLELGYPFTQLCSLYCSLTIQSTQHQLPKYQIFLNSTIVLYLTDTYKCLWEDDTMSTGKTTRITKF